MNLLANLILIPGLGAMGAAVAMVTAEASILVVQYFFVFRDVSVSVFVRDSAPYLVFAVVMFLVVRLLGGLLAAHGAGVATWLALVIQMACGGALYLVLSLVYLRFGPQSPLNSILHIRNRGRVS